MDLDGTVISVSVATVEFVPSGNGTTQAIGDGDDHALEARLRAALRVALKARDALAVAAAALRSALGAIDNAGAVDVPGDSAGAG